MQRISAGQIWRRVLLAAVASLAFSGAAPAPQYDVLIAQGMIYDGSGSAPFVGDVAIKGDRIVYAGPHAGGTATRTVDAAGKAVTGTQSRRFVRSRAWTGWSDAAAANRLPVGVGPKN